MPNFRKGARATQPQVEKPRLKRRWIFLFIALVLGVSWLIGLQRSHGAPPGASTSTPGAAQTPVSNQTPAPSPILTRTPGASADQVAAQFLAGYFTWDPNMTSQAYVNQWAGAATPDGVAHLATLAPRLTMNGGHDLQAKSPIPAISAANIQISGKQATTQVSWVVQTLPEGGELATWVNNQVQASISLIANGAGWQVDDIHWSVAA